MSCKPFKDQLEAYVLGLLSDKEKIKLEKHLVTCSACEKEFKVHQQASTLIEKAFDQEPPEYIRSKVMANLKDVKVKKSTWYYWAAPGLVGVMVLLLVIKMDPGNMLKEQAVMSAPPKATEMLDEVLVPETEPGPLKARRHDQPVIIEKKEMDKLFSGIALGDTKTKSIQSMKVQRLEIERESYKKKSAYKNSEYQKASKPKSAERAFAPEMEDIMAKKELAPAPQVAQEPEASHLAVDEEAMPMAAPMASRSKDNARGGSLGRGAGITMAPSSLSRERVSSGVANVRLEVVNINGSLDKHRVGAEIEELQYNLKQRLSREPNRIEALIIVEINYIGAVTDVQMQEDLFKSAELNQYVISQIKQINFGSTSDQSKAQVTIRLQVK